VRIALTCTDSSGTLVAKIAPCGACLQVIAEFGTGNTAIVIDGRGAFRLADFLPLPFGAESLKAHDGVSG
jgi:cytidine deaminase